MPTAGTPTSPSLIDAWVGQALAGVREMEAMQTYGHFSTADLPPVPMNLSADFAWLSPVLTGAALRNPNFKAIEDIKAMYAGEGMDGAEAIARAQQQLKALGISLPEEIVTFFCAPGINGRIASSTDNFWDIGEEIAVIQGDVTYYLLRFFADSQYTVLWYICFTQEGGHCIVASPNAFGTGEDTRKPEEKPLIGYRCAASFLEFIYRYDIEQRIWYKSGWYDLPLTVEERAYLDHYRNRPTSQPFSLPLRP